MSTLKNLYIIGAGGFGREVAWLVERINAETPTWNLKGFLDDNADVQGTLQGEYPVVGGCDYLKGISKEVWLVCAVGASKTRRSIIEKLNEFPNVRYATLIDPSVICSKRVTIGEGSIICAGTILTVDISIGKHVIINLDCTIGHDDVVHDFVTIYPSANVSGNVVIGSCSELGTGSQIIQGKRIIDSAIIGAGAVVVSDIKESGTYVGVPARNANMKQKMTIRGGIAG